MNESQPLSAHFARDLRDFLDEALPTPSNLVTVLVEDGLLVGPAATSGSARFDTIALDGTETSPRLRVEYKLWDDPSGEFFRVVSSTFGLLAPTDKGATEAKPVPIVRVEFERSQRPPAHIHFHTSSQTLGWVYGRAGGRYRRAEDLHFPIGSQRFVYGTTGRPI